MIFPAITAAHAALLGLIFVALSAWVIAGRNQYKVLHNDGGVEALNRRMRAHANFAEYVPMTLILIGALEASGGSPAAVRALGAILVVARIMHPVGMVAPENSLQQYAFRATSVVATIGVIAVSAVMLLLRHL